MTRRVKYWCNIPVSFPWRSTGHYRDLRIWLLDNVPHHYDYDIDGQDYDYHPVKDHRVVYFAREEDAIMFALRWA
jgi:hypothetical protein